MRTQRLLPLLSLTLLLGALPAALVAQTPFATGLDFTIGVTQLEDDRVLVVQGGLPGNVLAFDPDGTPLPNFASGIDGPVFITHLSDGRVLLSQWGGVNIILAFEADGTPLPTFADSLNLPTRPTQLEDGRVLVSEFFIGNVIAFNADGTGRTPFASGLGGMAEHIVQLQDGRVLVAVSAGSGGVIRAFEPDGTVLPDFGSIDRPPGAMTQLSDGRILVAQKISGVIASFDPDGTRLADFGTGPPDPRDMTQLADSRLLVSDQGGTVNAYQVMPTATEPDAELPSGVALGGAYPNPFATVATVPFTLARSGEVRLVVYDALGRQVAVLAQGHLPAGAHAAAFDAAGVPSGPYLVRLTVDGHVQSQRVTVTR